MSSRTVVAHRRDAEAAVAHHDRGHAVAGQRVERGVPEHLEVVVGVRVDQPGRDERARASTSRSPSGARPSPTSAITPSRTRTSPGRAGPAGAVDDRAAADDQIRHHVLLGSFSGTVRSSIAIRLQDREVGRVPGEHATNAGPRCSQ